MLDGDPAPSSPEKAQQTPLQPGQAQSNLVEQLRSHKTTLPLRQTAAARGLQERSKLHQTIPTKAGCQKPSDFTKRLRYTGLRYQKAPFRISLSTSFLQRAQCSHCKRCISYSNSVYLSVRPSVTRRYCVKTTALSTVQFAPLDSKMCLVLPCSVIHHG